MTISILKGSYYTGPVMSDYLLQLKEGLTKPKDLKGSFVQTSPVLDASLVVTASKVTMTNALYQCREQQYWVLDTFSGAVKFYTLKAVQSFFARI